jgi:hypothetical protein
VVLAVCAAALVGCGKDSDSKSANRDNATSTSAENTPAGDAVPLATGAKSGLTPPDTCQVVPAAALAEVTGTVTAGEQQLAEGTEDDGVEFAASTCTYTMGTGTIGVALIATTDPDGYVTYLEAQVGNTIVGNADVSGLPETTVVIDHTDGTRTYLVTDAALYSTTAPPGLAKQVAVWLYSRV